MFAEYNRYARLRPELGNQFKHLARSALMEMRGRLVKEQHLWFHGHRRGERNPLLLPE